MIIKSNLRLPPRHLNHTIDLRLEIISLLQDFLDMIKLQSLISSIPLRDRSSREKYIPYLTSVQFLERRLLGPIVAIRPV